MQIVCKRGHFYVVDDKGNILLKTNDESAAKKLAGPGHLQQRRLYMAIKRKKRKVAKKKTSSNEQTPLFSSKIPSKKKV